MKASSTQMHVNGSSSIGAMAFLPTHGDGSRDRGSLIAANESVASARIFLRQGRNALTRTESHFKVSRNIPPEQRDKVRLELATLDNYKKSFAVEKEILEIIDTYLDDLSSREGLDLQESNKIRLRLDVFEGRREALILERKHIAQSHR